MSTPIPTSKPIPQIPVPSDKEDHLVYAVVGQAGALGQLRFASDDGNSTTMIGLDIEPTYSVDVTTDKISGRTIVQIFVTMK